MDFNILKKAYNEIVDGYGYALPPPFDLWLKWNGIGIIKEGDCVHSIGVSLSRQGKNFVAYDFTDSIFFEGKEVYTDQDDEGNTYWYYFLNDVAYDK